MAVLDDAASIKRLKAVFQEHLDKHDADIGLTPYADDGISAAPNQLYTTPAPAPVGPPAQSYADGGEVSPYTRFTEDGDRTAGAWARYAPKGDYQSYDYMPRFSDPTDLARGVVDAAKGIGRDFADSGYNPARYLIHGADRFGQNYLGGITPQDVADMAVPHDLGDQYGLSGRVADALSTVMPGVGSLAIPPLYEGARYVADKYLPKFGEGGSVIRKLLADVVPPRSRVMAPDVRSQYRELHAPDNDNLSRQQWQSIRDWADSRRNDPEFRGIVDSVSHQNELDEQWRRRLAVPQIVPEYAEGGRVSRLIKQITNTRGAFQGERATKAADLANLDRISSNGVLDLFDSDKSSLLTAMPPSKFEDYATRLPITSRGVVPYPRFENYPGRNMPRWQDQTYDNYLDKLAQSMKTGPQDRRAYAPGELWMYKNPEDLTEIEGHEGRHRMAALARLGDESGLVHLRPVNPGELNIRPDMEERINDLKQKYFPQGADTPIVPQFTLKSRYNFKGEPQMGKFDITNRDALPLPAAPFGEGGKVLSQVIREITGKPSSIKIAGEGAVGAYPIREFEDVAKKFSSRYGNDYPISAYPKFDEDKARRIAEAYDAMKHDPADPRVKRSYDALVDETMDQYRALKDTGARFEFLKPGEADPYAKTPSLGYLDLVRNGRLKVFPTEQGYGTQTDISDNPLLKRVGRVGDLDNATANDAFRVVHDALGHFGPGNPFFRAPGEERAWYAHSHSYSPDALPAATSELRGQNSWVNYGPHGEANRSASGADTVYADQKAGLLPEWAYRYREGGVVNKLARKFLVDPVRERFPGIYQDPDKLIEQAKKRFVPDLGKEGPMYSLFGHTRDSLDELSQGKRAAEAYAPWREPPYNLSGTARTSPQILTRPNANRLVDIIGAGLDDPAIRGTRSWYEMSPMWERMKQLGASDDEMRNLNNRMSVMSAGSDPKTEINRGFYANWLANNGRLEDFVKYGGVPDEGRGDWFPRDMMGLQGHAYHGTAHVPNLLDNEFTGRVWGKEHKVPTYAAATDPLRPYSDRPIADSHFSRILGYPDVSTAVTDAERKGVMSGTQYSDMVPWFQKNVANRLDMRPRDAQALLWNLGGPQTGVRYIGPSKLEMISNHMDNVAKELGISPDMARDKLLKGEIGGSTAFDAPFKRGGEVEDFFNEFQAMNYRKGGATRDPDDVLNYHPLFFRHGGKYKAP